MRRPLAVLALFLLAPGCATGTGTTTAEPEVAAVEDHVYGPGVPASVRVERAIHMLEHGEGPEVRRARSALAAQEPEDMETVRQRCANLPQGSELRMELLAVLAERGETPAGIDLSERVAVDIHVIAHCEPGGYGVLRALSRIAGMKEDARAPLDALAAGEGPDARAAEAVLQRLFDPDRDSQGMHP